MSDASTTPPSEGQEPAEPNLDIQDPISSMLSVAIELHEMAKALEAAGFSHADVVIMIGHAIASGVMLPQDDFGPDDIDAGISFISEFDEGDLLDGEDDEEDFDD